MDSNNKRTILNFIWLLAKLWLLTPLVYLMICNTLIIYLPTMFIRTYNIIIYMIIYFLLLWVSASIAYGLWSRSTSKVIVFTSTTYKETVKLPVKNAKNRFKDYLNFIKKIEDIFCYIESKKNLSGFIGILIDWLILFSVNPFRRMLVC